MIRRTAVGRVRTFAPPLKPEDIRYDFCGEVESLESFLEYSLQDLEYKLHMGRKELFKDVIKRPNWKEVVVEEVSSKYDGRNLMQTLAPMSSYEAQARRLGLTHKQPLIGNVVLISAENEIILGLGGMGINTYPTYYATYKEQRLLNPLTDSLYVELWEKGGLREDDVKNVELIGCFYDNEYTRGPNYVWRVQSNNSTDEIIEKQKQAPDSWEYDTLFPSENTAHSVVELMRTPLYQLFPLARGALFVYYDHLMSLTNQ